MTVDSSGGIELTASAIMASGTDTIRPGTPEECAGLQPEGIPAP